MLPSAMRVFFGRILVHCEPSDAISLWEKFKIALSEDYLQTYDEYTAFTITYKEVSNICTEEGKTIEKVLNIPELIIAASEINLEEQHDIDYEKEKAMEEYAMLNSDQKLIIDNVLNKMDLPIPPGSNSGK
jgi:1-aminocyclopropane-1-carboxylate deaminase/D-cysteine desulfhydrase-like pyridoxal-dependent ACC family enzyme